MTTKEQLLELVRGLQENKHAVDAETTVLGKMLASCEAKITEQVKEITLLTARIKETREKHIQERNKIYAILNKHQHLITTVDVKQVMRQVDEKRKNEDRQNVQPN